MLRHPRLTHPVAIGQFYQANNQQSLRLVATMRASTLHILLGESFTTALAQHIDTPVTSQTIYVPGYALQSLGSDLRQQMNTFLHPRLGFTKTQPDLLGYASQFESTLLSISPDNTATLGVLGASDSFTETAQRWAEDEERRHRPQDRTFLLPDGSTGVETIPGDLKPVFGPPANNCQHPTVRAIPYTICHQKPFASITTSDEALTPKETAEPWHISLSHQDFQGACQHSSHPLAAYLCAATTISATGSFNATHIAITYPEL